MKHWILVATLVCGTTSFASCIVNHDQPVEAAVVAQYIPKAPDYDDPTMWVTADGDIDGTGADVFYVVSTWVHRGIRAYFLSTVISTAKTVMISTADCCRLNPRKVSISEDRRNIW